MATCTAVLASLSLDVLRPFIPARKIKRSPFLNSAPPRFQFTVWTFRNLIHACVINRACKNQCNTTAAIQVDDQSVEMQHCVVYLLWLSGLTV